MDSIVQRLRQPPVQLALIALVGFIAYLNTFGQAMHFDDFTYVADNPALGSWDYFTSEQSRRGLDSMNLGAHFRNRIVGFFTFAINYRIGGLHVGGYHAVNLMIHIGAAIVLYRLVELLFSTPLLAAFAGRGAAFWVAALFVAHPIQTQAVTYISQRFTSLAALLYLATLLLYLRSRLMAESAESVKLYVWAVVCALLAVKTKEIALTLPVMALLLEVCFLEASWGLRARKLLPFFLLVLIIPLTLIDQKDLDLQGAMSTANFQETSRHDYLLTQFRAVATYLRLMVLPVNQNLDYDYALSKSLLDPAVLGAGALHLALLGSGLWLMLAGRRAGRGLMVLGGMGIWWFYIAMAVDSSVFPLLDLINEHRVYMSAAGFMMAVVAGALWLIERRPALTWAMAGIGAVVVMTLAGVSYARNMAWQDEVTLWQNASLKAPNKARPHNNLGYHYMKHKQPDKAIAEFRRAVQLRPDYIHPRYNLAQMLYKKDPKGAEEQLKKIFDTDPHNADAHNMLGYLYMDQGDADKGLREFLAAINYKPTEAAFTNIGDIYYKGERNLSRAAFYYQRAIEINPYAVHTYLRLQEIFTTLGQKDNADKYAELAQRAARATGVVIQQQPKN